METRSVGDLVILTPDLDPRDLDDTTDPPDDDLVEANVDGTDWSRLHLTGARVRLSHLAGVNLVEVAWRNVTFYGCRFERVDFSSARLTGMTVERCEFVGCRMTGLLLGETTLKNVIFEDCRLDYATLADVRATGPAAWTRCTLTETTMANCRLPSVAIRSCNLAGLVMDTCDLRQADLRDNDLSQVTGLASLHGVRLAQEQLPGLATSMLRELAIEMDGQDSHFRS
ncbi:pentapeptide repeat-containing protein [Planosporangium sp. 12N6]|uniref:pentapeptide repeat-containing protein n=1 Tax=Planosporangium spinosum TaxID=3402278 RepID=UPI003CEC64AB